MEQVKFVHQNKKHLAAVFAAVFEMLLMVGCSHVFGVYHIKGNIYFWDAGTPHERIIVYNENKSSRIIGFNGAASVIPNRETFEQSCKNGISEYVESYAFDKEWLIARSVAELSKHYWVLRFPTEKKASLEEIEKKTIGPLDSVSFYQLVREENIGLRFCGGNESE